MAWRRLFPLLVALLFAGWARGRAADKTRKRRARATNLVPDRNVYVAAEPGFPLKGV